MLLVHGTCVVVAGRGVLIRGTSGSGKSDLALRLIDAGARLVADDQVEIEQEDDRLLASPPSPIAGLLEVRGLGIVSLDHQAPVPLALVVDLVKGEEIERMPADETVELAGRQLRRLALDPREASAVAKVRLAIRTLSGGILSTK
ncbi:MAG TPA: serine/threonine protein kinase [Rhodospirillaceae bacterium]|nr:serine/threonine protein kinase [Rhodospirillaceae bacterium]